MVVVVQVFLYLVNGSVCNLRQHIKGCGCMQGSAASRYVAIRTGRMPAEDDVQACSHCEVSCMVLQLPVPSMV